MKSGGGGTLSWAEAGVGALEMSRSMGVGFEVRRVKGDHLESRDDAHSSVLVWCSLSSCGSSLAPSFSHSSPPSNLARALFSSFLLQLRAFQYPPRCLRLQGNMEGFRHERRGGGGLEYPLP